MDGTSTYNIFLVQHKAQLVLSNVPEHFWRCLCKKLYSQIFDAGATFSLLKIEGDVKPFDPKWAVQCQRDVQRNDPNEIYLIDHAWTFKADNYSRQLRNIPGLLQRMSQLTQTEGIEEVANELWRYAQTYAVAGDEFSVEERVPVWYIMDELGSGIPHSDSPNFRTVPFIFVPQQITYSLLFPIEDVEESDFVSRNFVEGDFTDEKHRQAMLIPWQHYPYFHDDYNQVEPEASYFLSGHIEETLPDTLDPPLRTSNKLKVFSDYSFINRNLTSPDFQVVENEDDADILWYLNHFKKFRELNEVSPNKFVNQFPYEYVITVKDLLAIVARRCKDHSSENNELHTSPSWLPTTFNMKTELDKLVAYYWKRKEAGLDNNWICKPFNLARGLDTYITSSLNFLCRLPLTGPKIAQKYIEDPVLFERPEVGPVKFDIRYVILLKSVRPTKVFIYRNFFLRFSNKPFALSDFDDYEQHFTVMNYNENAPLFRMLCADFKINWEKQNPEISWSEVEGKIFDMFAQLFTAATSVEPPCGIAKNPQSRALYAADIMLAWKTKNNERVVEPQLLEVNWMPDCQRACDYYPDFYNDVFSVLFLDKEVETCKNIL